MVSSTSPSHSPPISPPPPLSAPPPPSNIPSLCFLVPKCLNQLHFVTLHPQLLHFTSLLLYSWLCLLFFLMFFTIFPWQLPNFSWVITRSFFPMSKASITSSIFPPKHFQHLMPSTFTAFFYHIITTGNSILSSYQMSRYPPFLILHSHTSRQVFIPVVYIYY